MSEPKKLTAEERAFAASDYIDLHAQRFMFAGTAARIAKEHAAQEVAEFTRERDNWRDYYQTMLEQAIVHVERARKAERERDEARAEVERLREALTPSEKTKAAYIGEVTEPDATRAAGKRTVSWTAIKDTMALIRQRAALKAADGGEVKP